MVMKKINNIYQFFEKSDFYQIVDQALNQPGRHAISGVQGSLVSFILARAFFKKQRQIIVFAANLDEINNIIDDLINFVDSDKIYHFSTEEVLFSTNLTASPENQHDRAQFMNALLTKKKGIYFLTPESLVHPVTSPKIFANASFEINLDKDISRESLIQKLELAGLKRKPQVEKIGEYAVRGNIVDFYTFGEDTPIRVELFDTQVDSIRRFSLDTQRSLDKLKKVQIIPVSDRLITNDKIKKILNSKNNVFLVNYLKSYLDSEKQIENFPYLETIIGDNLITSYFNSKSPVFFIEWAKIIKTIAAINQQLMQLKKQLNEEKHYYRSIFVERNFSGLLQSLVNPQIYLSNIQRGVGNVSFKSQKRIIARNVPSFVDQLTSFEKFLIENKTRKATIILSLPEANQVESVEKVLIDLNQTYQKNEKEPVLNHQINITSMGFNQGFDLVNENIILISTAELFSTKNKRRRRVNFSYKNSRKITTFSELKVGDYVVHINHGIGRFVGMKTEVHGGISRDYITIQFAGSGKLYLPVNQIQFIQKYQSDNGIAPKLNNLGSSEWRKTRAKVSKKIDDMADELINRYAQRQTQKGFSFSPHSDYESEFAAAFPYLETPDQKRSIKEVLSDMEKGVPMDRLLVGDVGFGKTEVAMRASFKAVLDHKQVAVLAPTTILVQQHYNSFIDRFRNFPVDIEMVSRFRTSKEIKEIINKLKRGQTDIVIGTHRLLSKDVQFKDLGLLVIDEEQRFGVKHKERLKALKNNVDVLTLTATPIPRTLQLATLGVMDLSLIETAPPDRYPVMTYVNEYSVDLIQDAISRELQRHGQVFYLHNRVSDIEQTVSFLQGIFPKAEIGYIDGQMSESQLENTMLDFLERRFDILVTTTIIEIGVDIPNANTLIVENADRFGLSTLYQLRGRIGRSNRIAYAYLTYQPNRSLTETSEKRLSAIRDFTELGSGYKLALTDLSIRGAGNILGKEQHGFINEVGFDLFLEMLSDAVKNKMGRQNKYHTKSVVELDWSNYISDSYISDHSEKIEMYQKILHAQSDNEVNDILDELIDRFGEPPISVLNLLNTARIKIQADHAGIEKITSLNGSINLNFSPVMNRILDKNIFQQILKSSSWPIKLSQIDKSYKIIINNSDENITSEHFLRFIKKIKELVTEKENEIR